MVLFYEAQGQWKYRGTKRMEHNHNPTITVLLLYFAGYFLFITIVLKIIILFVMFMKNKLPVSYIKTNHGS